MKSIPVALQTHFDSRSTTLATMWIVASSRGITRYFTDHDIDIVYDSNTYASISGYAPTNIKSTSTAAVDNLDMHGLLDSLGITREDLLAGIYDNAACRVFSINYESPSDGEIKHKSGYLGEVRTADDFTAEFRSIAQALQQTVGSLYSHDCRYDFGDANCALTLQGSTSAGAHRWWRVYEPNSITLVKIGEVSMALSSAAVDQCTGGTIFASGSTGAGPKSEAFDDVYTTWWGAAGGGGGSPHFIGYVFASAQEILEVRLRVGDGSPGVMPEDFSIQYSDDGITYYTSASFTGVVYTGAFEQRVFVASPPTIPSYIDAAAVTSTTSAFAFVASTLTAGDDYYKYGTVSWLTGNNSSLVMEVKSYASGGAITLFQPMPYEIQDTDTFNISAGCNKSWIKCGEYENRLNFGGEPHVPGSNAATRFGGQ